MDPYKITIDTFNRLASAYQDKFMDMDLHHDGFDVFCELTTKPQAQIFEIACGPGNITKYILSKRPDLVIEGIDLAPNMVQLAIENNPTATFKVMDGREISSINKKYDGIICGFCMPYLSKEECIKMIGDCAQLLNPGGLFYFSTIEGDHAKSGYETGSNGVDKAYVHYHQEDYLQEALLKNHFELVELKRKNYPKPDGSHLVDMVFIVRKK